MTSTLTRIQNWYKTNCNSDWEHSYGISICTLDNPGWTIKINLQETSLENLNFDRTFQNNGNTHDWFFIKSENGVLNISCGPDNLEQVLKIFLDEIISEHSDNGFLYEIYLPMTGYKYDIWRPASGKLINEGEIKLTEIPEINFKEIKVTDIEAIDFDQKTLERLETIYKVGDIVSTDIQAVFDGLILTVKKEKLAIT